MKSFVFLPNVYKKLGWALIFFAFLLWLCGEVLDIDTDMLEMWIPSIYSTDGVADEDKQGWFAFMKHDMAYTLFSALFILGGLILLFAREKVEDEFIHSVRYSAMGWALSLNYIFLLIAFLGVYGPAFINVVIYNVYSVLLIYLIRFHYLLFINKRQMTHEE